MHSHKEHYHAKVGKWEEHGRTHAEEQEKRREMRPYTLLYIKLEHYEEMGN